MTAANEPLPVSFDDVTAAAGRLAGIVRRTPLETSRTLDRLLGARAFLKCESFQRVGAFKFRGAYHALSRLDDEQRARGVLTHSSGNHAQAVALAGQLLDIRTTVVMPADAPAAKAAATREYGARIVSYDPAREVREDVAARIQADEGSVLIPPFDHADVIAGQGTAALELFEDAGALDVLLVPCGGGGLLSGSALVARALHPACRIIGVEPEAGDDAMRSFRTGTLQRVHNPDTIADGARTASLGRLTFPIVRRLASDMLTVSDAQIVAAMRLLWERMKLVVEPTGALAVAAALAGKVDLKDTRVGIILSGGNVDLARAAALFAAEG